MTTKKPYGVAADLHFHNWSAFSEIDTLGQNSRLVGLNAELKRAATELKNAGGKRLYVAGDVFHVRGSVAPTVLNPVIDTVREIIQSGIAVRILAGNHDLERKHAERLSSAITALESAGAHVVHTTTTFADDQVVMVPWYESLDELKAELETLSKAFGPEWDLMLHAPIDGVIPGLPDHGLTSAFLHSLQFDFVFAGHYHNHKKLSARVYSVGALAHHTWSDVGTKAGFLIVDDNVRWMKSHLPEFIDITGETDPEELPLIVEGNFVRCKTDSSKTSEVESLRSELLSLGAKGVVIQQVKKPSVERSEGVSATVSAGASVEVSVAEYVRSKFTDSPNVKLISDECANVLMEAGI